MHLAFGIDYEFEDLLLGMTQGILIAPQNVSAFVRARRVPVVGRSLGWAMGGCVGRFQPVRSPCEKPGERVLFLTAMGLHSLAMLNAVQDWRKSFDLVVAFVLDAFEPCPPEVASRLDHLFIIIPELVGELQKSLGIPVTFMPLACDVLGKATVGNVRGIDVLAYGRQSPVYAGQLERHFLREDSSRLYLAGFTYPHVTDWRQQRKGFWNVLSRTRISLAFAPDPTQSRFRDLPVINARWYEGLAAGCVMVGKPPATPVFSELFDWPDAVIELPKTPADAPAFVEGLLDQHKRLARAHLRNHLMMLRRHDARLIFQEMCQVLGVDLPAGVGQEIERLQRRSEEVSALGGAATEEIVDGIRSLPRPAMKTSRRISELTLRRMDAGDVSEVLQICRWCFPSSLRWHLPDSDGLRWWNRLLELPSCEAWVICLGTDTVGFCVLVKDVDQFRKDKRRLGPKKLRLLHTIGRPYLSIARPCHYLRALWHGGKIECDQTYGDCEAQGLAWLEMMGVLPSWWRQGVGHQLLNLCIRRSKDLGFEALKLLVRIDNRGAILFYQKLGFRIVGRHGIGVVMAMDLRGPSSR